MNTSILKLLVVVAIPSMLALGCGGSSTSKNTSHDMAMKVTTGDMAASTGCTELTFPTDSNSVGAFLGNDMTDGYDYIAGVGSITQNADGSTYNDIDFEFWHKSSAAAPTLPLTTTYSSTNMETNSLKTCAECLTVQTGTSDPADPFGPPADGKLFLATSGTTTATKLDHTGTTGTVAVTFTDVGFVEWDGSNDVAVTNGGCATVSSLSISAMYDNSMPDM